MQVIENQGQKPKARQWIDGIELLRAAAVVLVTISHGFYLINNWNNLISNTLISSFTFFFKPGWWGVRIFFAISGYLIASQSIKVIYQGSTVYAKNFAIRRWIRTVPTYWMFLVAITIFSSSSLFTNTFLENALFMQTVRSNASLIEVGWSLVIEEWSYGIISIFLIVSTALIGSRSQKCAAAMIAALALTLIVIATFFRYKTCLSSEVSWETLKRNPFLQLDALSMGAFLACVQTLFKETLQRIMRYSTPIVIGALLGMSITGWWINKSIVGADVINTQTWLTLGLLVYPLCSLLSALLVLGCFHYKASTIHKAPRQLIQIIATTSYSTYLIHLYVLQGLRAIPAFTNSGSAFWIYLLLSITAGVAAFELTEKPFLKLRERFRT